MIERIALYDPEAIRQGLAGAADDDDYVLETAEAALASPEEAQWRRTLMRIADDPRGPMRPVLMGTEEMAADVSRLDEHAPHFSAVTSLARRAVLASARTQTRVRLPPILIVGPPGLGKTRYARRLAHALGGIHLVEIAVNLANERGRFTGYSPTWRGARMSDFAAGLLASANRCSAPMFLLDEVDKPPARDEHVHEALLSMLEPENSAIFIDEYLSSIVPLRLDHALVLATANDVHAISQPLLDRMLVIDILAPVGEAVSAVIASIFADVAAGYGTRFSTELDPLVAARLATWTPRLVKRILELAIPVAIEGGRWRLTHSDLDEASSLMRPGRLTVGFLQRSLGGVGT